MRLARPPRAGGRILRDGAGQVAGIVEHKDASDAQRPSPRSTAASWPCLRACSQTPAGAPDNNNAQGEYYLTDIVAMAVADGGPVVAAHASTTRCRWRASTAPCNWPSWSAPTSAQARADGAGRASAPARFDLRDDAPTGVRGELLSAGRTWRSTWAASSPAPWSWAKACAWARNCCIANARIAAGAIHPHTHIDGEKTRRQRGRRRAVGPFARLRPGAVLGREVHIGNFVEVKNSRWPMAPRPTTWPTWATPRWASA